MEWRVIELYEALRRNDVGSRYMVLSSLPHLERFERATRLPIGRETLAARLALLPAADGREISRAISIMNWKANGRARSDADLIADYEQVRGRAETRGLRDLIDFRLGLRAIIAGLRRRRLGLPAPRPGDRSGAGPWARHVQLHFDEPDFRLQHVLPWVPLARRLLDEGNATELEHLLFGLVWNKLDAMQCANRFGSDAVLAYVFKWDLVDRWLRRDSVLAAQKLEALALEALGEFGQPFN
jgi:hypothetical protein